MHRKTRSHARAPTRIVKVGVAEQRLRLTHLDCVRRYPLFAWLANGAKCCDGKWHASIRRKRVSCKGSQQRTVEGRVHLLVEAVVPSNELHELEAFQCPHIKLWRIPPGVGDPHDDFGIAGDAGDDALPRILETNNWGAQVRGGPSTAPSEGVLGTKGVLRRGSENWWSFHVYDTSNATRSI